MEPRASISLTNKNNAYLPRRDAVRVQRLHSPASILYAEKLRPREGQPCDTSHITMQSATPDTAFPSHLSMSCMAPGAG